MVRPPQKRRLETRAKLLSVAEQLIRQNSYAGLRVEDVVADAGVAKGTLFSHFKDKDGLLAVLIGAEVMRLLDQMAEAPAPKTLPDLQDKLEPLLAFLTSDRVIFDLLLRYSGSTGSETDEVITEGFFRQIAIWAGWIGSLQTNGRVRADLDPGFLAEGIQAFLTQTVAISFCAGAETKQPPMEALRPFLQAWLAPLT